jgi:3-hydroxybutyryl-CoA dehydrogenase
MKLTPCDNRSIRKIGGSDVDLNTIGVIGAGTMGRGISHTAAESGFHVYMYDANPAALESALAQISQRVARNVRSGKTNQADCDALLGRLQLCGDVRELKNCSYVIEAATEKMDVKKAIFRSLDAVCDASTVFATNTSGLSVTEIASVMQRPEQVVGTHFFNPVPVMKLVEVIRGTQTSDATVTRAMDVCHQMGKTCIDVKEAPLFVVNRILVPMINEAIFVLQEGLASAEDIDKGMQLGANHPIGPLALADLVGLDTLLMVAETLYEETADSKYRPAPLLKQLVRANRLGRKTGHGFYTYES